jgi:kanamycin kinase
VPVPIGLPQEVVAAYPHASSEVVWILNPQGAVWRLIEPDNDPVYVKVLAHGLYPSLEDERERIEWASDRLPVPPVLGRGSDEKVEWLALGALPGRDATHPELMGDPETTVPILGRGLRAFHETEAADCPFDFSLDAALAHGRRRVDGDGVPKSRGDFHEEHLHLDPAGALRVLEATRPDSEDLVLCHGDYCFPNILIRDGKATGFLDLGEMGVADRWWDLAVATWSCDWNVGPGYQDLFLESYGIERDEERIAYYRLLYDLAS